MSLFLEPLDPVAMTLRLRGTILSAPWLSFRLLWVPRDGIRRGPALLHALVPGVWRSSMPGPRQFPARQGISREKERIRMHKTDENRLFSHIKHDLAEKSTNRPAREHRTEHGARPESTGRNMKALFPKTRGQLGPIYY